MCFRMQGDRDGGRESTYLSGPSLLTPSTHKKRHSATIPPFLIRRHKKCLSLNPLEKRSERSRRWWEPALPPSLPPAPFLLGSREEEEEEGEKGRSRKKKTRVVRRRRWRERCLDEKEEEEEEEGEREEGREEGEEERREATRKIPMVRERAWPRV